MVASATSLLHLEGCRCGWLSHLRLCDGGLGLLLWSYPRWRGTLRGRNSRCPLFHFGVDDAGARYHPEGGDEARQHGHGRLSQVASCAREGLEPFPAAHQSCQFLELRHACAHAPHALLDAQRAPGHSRLSADAGFLFHQWHLCHLLL